MADRGVQPNSNQSQPKVVQPPYDNSIKKNPGAQAIPPRVEMEHKSNRDGRIKRVMCYKCGEKGHYANRCPTKQGGQDGCPAISCERGNIPQQCCNRSKSGHHTRRCPAKRSVDMSQWSCYNCGKKGLLAEQCPLNEEYRKKGMDAFERRML